MHYQEAQYLSLGVDVSRLQMSVYEGVSMRIGDAVKFRRGNVFLEPQEDLLLALPHDAEIQGRLIGFSDAGLEPRVFAVVEVEEAQSFVVRVSDLEVIETDSDKRAAC